MKTFLRFSFTPIVQSVRLPNSFLFLKFCPGMNSEEPSLLSHLNEARFKALSEGGLTTVIYCGRVRSENDLPNALNLHRSIVEQEVNKEQVNVTGILMGQVSLLFVVLSLSFVIVVQSNSILHLLEGPCYSVLRILHNLSVSEQFGSGGGDNSIQKGSIVYNLEDRPNRFFPEWYSCVINEQKSPSDDTSEETVFDMACRLLDLGSKLKTEPQEELELSR
jgi:hypothetical protein